MRKPNFLQIKLDRFPKGSFERLKDIRSIMQYAYSCGYDVTSVDYNTGMIQFFRGKTKVKLNFYTTKFTLVIAKDGSQHSKKFLNKKRIKELLDLYS